MANALPKDTPVLTVSFTVLLSLGIEEYFAGVEIDLPIAVWGAFPLIFLCHVVPPVLEFGASLAHVLHEFLIKLGIVGSEHFCKLV